ncbi:hypothetical protein GUITHDRAFT_96730 [Guillardia theta CCMP2712]|uniref:Glutaredoxin domain-containing protein n=1 Tax=Guillardia theta (strain CCMP2712) TaxID=905079 RepID=L1IT08_GUITC|nr:hypothetical protein GUITHDRAFT_96730 [Guillardia theta CCMP2712]EKX39391.1 hypothetical protein GUITHDRAFT_96730 [Guillardia theta CCMP2712]|eukprot:XP_005826371.1 hypothetical protein GUITHDRAFT_96730 [Guillardia theta CCMP2712]
MLSLRRSISLAAVRARPLRSGRHPALRAWGPAAAGPKSVAIARSFATVGSEGSDSDFAPKAKAPAASEGRNVQAEIKNLVSSRKVVLFMKGTPDFPMCGFSNKAVQILDFHRTQYGAFNVLEDMEVREGVKQFSAWPTIPQLFVNGEFVGGCDIMMEMHQNGELKQLLSDAGALK